MPLFCMHENLGPDKEAYLTKSHSTLLAEPGEILFGLEPTYGLIIWGLVLISKSKESKQN